MTLAVHLKGKATTVARCWLVRRRDGHVLGMTDHDRDLSFEGHLFLAGAALDGAAISQTSGLAVDNGEVSGALSHMAIQPEDLRAGRFDGAEVEIWWVNWADVRERALQFRGTLGEVSHSAGTFEAELRGLSEPLNVVRERVYQPSCSADLGDRRCRVDLKGPGMSFVGHVTKVDPEARIAVALPLGTADLAMQWFERGVMKITSGQAAGLQLPIRDDRSQGALRHLVLWREVPAPLAVGDEVVLYPGCDRTAPTCRKKFNNFLNFRGFVDLPTEDWLMAAPKASA